MKPTTTIREALRDPELLGAVLSGPSWRAWRTMLIASMGERLLPRERGLFHLLTGRKREPLKQVEEVCAVVGRRGGKSRALSVLAVYIAALCEHRLAPGETGIALLIAPDQKQARIDLDFAAAALEQSPILKQLIVNRTADSIELRNRINIEVRSASFRRLRGPSYIAVIADEASFWYSDEWSSNADVEILNAVRPGLATTGGPLIIASSPYARRGVVWGTYKSHYGPAGDKSILVAQGASRRFNPSLPQSVVDRAYARDAASAAAEFGAQFRTDIEAFVSLETVEACVGDHVELPPAERVRYFGFVDPSGGGNDAMTLAIGHKDGERVVIDAIREVRPPFSPESVVDDFAVLCKSYRIRHVTGDRFGGEFCREPFRRRGIGYRLSAKSKSDLYRDALPLLNSRRISLPLSDRLVNQLVGLERRVSRGGKDSIDHAPNAHDDVCNVVCGAADLIIVSGRGTPPAVASYDNLRPLAWRDDAEAEAARNVAAGSAPCTIDFTKIQKPLPEGLTRRVGAPRIWYEGEKSR